MNREPFENSELAQALNEGAGLSRLQLALAAACFLVAVVWAVTAGTLFCFWNLSKFVALKFLRRQPKPKTTIAQPANPAR